MNYSIAETHLEEAEFERIKEERKAIDFPNMAEGYDHIFKVVDDKIIEVKEPIDDSIVSQAKKELERESLREKAIYEQDKKRKDLIDELEHGRKFWHYCEVCGKKELLTAEESFESGWDYPPHMGSWGVISMRTCGDCQMTDTLYWRLIKGEIEEFTEKDIETMRRIENEPFSLVGEGEE